MATKNKKSEFAGVGAFIQLIAVLLLFIFPIGTIIGLVLFCVGSAKSSKFICSDCCETVAKDAKVCKACCTPFN